MLDALIAGTHDPELLADLAKGALRKTLPALREALQGRFTGHHALLVSEMLAHIDFLDETVATPSERIEQLTARFPREIELLDSIPGVDRRNARMLPAEIGPDHEPLPDRRAPGLLGRPVPRPARVGRQAALRQDAQGLQVAAQRADRVRQPRRR
jgi:transposase